MCVVWYLMGSNVKRSTFACLMYWISPISSVIKINYCWKTSRQNGCLRHYPLPLCCVSKVFGRGGFFLSAMQQLNELRWGLWLCQGLTPSDWSIASLSPLHYQRQHSFSNMMMVVFDPAHRKSKKHGRTWKSSNTIQTQPLSLLLRPWLPNIHLY